MANDDAFSNGTLVLLGGLQSDVGKKLNGGQGIILDAQLTPEGRYKVAIFAIPKRALKKPPPTASNTELEVSVLAEDSLKIVDEQKQIKPVNLKVYPNPESSRLFTKVAQEQFEKAERKKDTKKMMIWSLAGNLNQPSQFQFRMNYGNTKRKLKKYKEASSWIYDIFQEAEVSNFARDPKSIPWLRDAVLAYCGAEEHLEDALQYAHWIPTDSVRHNAMARESLRDIVKATDIILTNKHNWGKYAPITKIKIAAMKTLHEREPSLESGRLLAGAYCLAEDWMEGAKWYRKILQEYKQSMPPQMVKDFETFLIDAQLHCQGMPLENCTVMFRGMLLGPGRGGDGSTAGNSWWYVRNEERGSEHDVVTMLPGARKVRGKQHINDYKEFRPPTDPDDPMFATLLERLRIS